MSSSIDLLNDYRNALIKIGVAPWNNSPDETGETAFLESAFKGLDNPLFIDVGANEGFFSIGVLECCPSAQVIAFEPHPHTFNRMLERSKLKGFRAINKGCSDKTGEAEIFDVASLDGSPYASLHEKVISGNLKEEVVKHKTQTIRLDEFLDENGIDGAYYLKVDTEGHEYNVLLGAGDYIKNGRFGIIHFEFHETNVYSRIFFKDFYDLLHESYNLHRITKEGLFPINEYHPLSCEIFGFQNIVCIKK